MPYLLFMRRFRRKGDPFVRFSSPLWLILFWSFTTDRSDGWNYRGKEWGDEINAHFKLRSFLISYFQTWHCVFTAAGAHCQLSLSHLQIEIDLPDREPRARGQTLSDAEELPVRRVVTWSLADCLFILQKTLWCGAEGETLSIMFNSSSSETIAAPTCDPGSVCRGRACVYNVPPQHYLTLSPLWHSCVIMYLRNCISPWLPPNILSDSESNIDTAYSYKWKRSSKLLVWGEDGVVFLWSPWPPESFLCSAGVHTSPPRPTVQKQRQNISECSHLAAVTSFETRVCVVMTSAVPWKEACSDYAR